MEIIKPIIRILGKPFPDEENWGTYSKKVIALSLFVAFFLYVFKPFGLDTLESDVLIICLGFGAMTFAGALVYELSLGQLFRLLGFHNKWTFGKWIVNTLITTLFISLANFIFSRLVLLGSIDWSLFPTMLYSTFMIGIFPVTTLGAWLLAQQEKKYKGIANEINQSKTSPVETAVEDKSIFNVPTGSIKYIAALQNYVKIGYTDVDGNSQIQTERLTLKEASTQTTGSGLTKCHRSFLVNKNAIISVSGNAQGLLLTLSNCDKIIPVSRTYVPLFRA